MKRIFVSIFFLHLFIFSIGQQQEVPFTLADRDRIIQTEVRIGGVEKEIISLRNEMDAKNELLSAKIDYLFWVQGVIIALIIFMLGFVIWDRRTALNPVRTDIEILKSENEKMKSIFRFLSETQPQLREMLKNAGIL